MKDNMEDFREASNTFLKDIYVTDELMRKTLEKCSNRRYIKITPLLASTISAALILGTFGAYNYFLHKTTIANNYTNNSIKHELKNSISSENSETISKSADSKNLDNSKSVDLKNDNNIRNGNSASGSKGSSTSTVTKNANTSAEHVDNNSQNGVDNSQINSTPQNKDSNTNMTNNTYIASESKMSNVENKDMSLSSEAPAASASLSASLNMASAEKYFGSEILLPTSIPDGFNLTAISIPDDKIKCIKLNYSSSSTYFEILQNKNLSKLEGTKTIIIKNNKAYVNSTKDEQSNNVTTKITWIMNNIEYSLYGNLPEDTLINIAKSMN